MIIQIWLISDKNKGYLHDSMYIYYNLAELFLESEMFQTEVVQEIKIFYLKKNFF